MTSICPCLDAQNNACSPCYKEVTNYTFIASDYTSNEILM